MVLNSIKYAFKDSLYNLEKLLAALRTSPFDEAERERLHACNHKNVEASLASGQFLDRARRGETLHHNKETDEILKEFVRHKTVCSEEGQAGEQIVDTTQSAITKSITDEFPVFGLKASLHASADHGSFDAWKNTHDLKIESSIEDSWQYLPALNPQYEDAMKASMRSWRDLSVNTALRLIDHPNTSGDVLMELAMHPSEEVRSQVADNLNTPTAAIEMLVKDESADVRLSMAECYHLDEAILEKLAEDENPYVCDRAQTTLQRLRANRNTSVIRTLFGSREAREESEAESEEELVEPVEPIVRMRARA